MCENPECAVRTFADPLPFASLNEYRTDRLNQLILGMSVFMSNEGTSRTLGLMGIQVSADSIDRLWKKVRLVDLPDVETIGIDDIALLKGRTYATAVYAENHQLIAILQVRTADDVMDWLRAHPKIRKMARDRASAYASALSEVLPDAVQVADRFHLLHHLEMVLKDELLKEFWVSANGLMEKDDVKWKRAQENMEVSADVSTLHYDNTASCRFHGMRNTVRRAESSDWVQGGTRARRETKTETGTGSQRSKDVCGRCRQDRDCPCNGAVCRNRQPLPENDRRGSGGACFSASKTRCRPSGALSQHCLQDDAGRAGRQDNLLVLAGKRHR